MEEKTMESKNIFEELYGINVNEYTEDREGLTYLTWSYAWAETLKKYPDAKYNIQRFGEDMAPYLYDEKLGYMVMTRVQIGDLIKEMWLPVMDSKNKAMKAEPYTYDTKFKKGLVVQAATMFDINKAIMRCLVKNLAMFGLGLYIYAGEDLPEEEKKEVVEKKRTATKKQLDELKKILGDERYKNFVDYAIRTEKLEKIEDVSPELIEKTITQLNATNGKNS